MILIGVLFKTISDSPVSLLALVYQSSYSKLPVASKFCVVSSSAVVPSLLQSYEVFFCEASPFLKNCMRSQYSFWITCLCLQYASLDLRDHQFLNSGCCTQSLLLDERPLSLRLLLLTMNRRSLVECSPLMLSPFLPHLLWRCFGLPSE